MVINVITLVLNLNQINNLKRWAYLKRAKEKHGIVVSNVDTSTSLSGI